jgi:polyisoprenoid-binding protein YceI
VAGPFVYIHFIEGSAPPRLSLATASPPTTAAASADDPVATAGTWTVAGGSQVGYRVKEILFGQSNTAVGRTSAVTGTMTMAGAAVTAAHFSVDMTTVTSDQHRRDSQFNGRIMDTASYPTATFTLTQPIQLGSIPAAGATVTEQAVGHLTLHGTTRAVTFSLTARQTGDTISVSGSIPITFADWNIPNPSFGPVSTDDHGVLEFLLNFTRS